MPPIRDIHGVYCPACGKQKLHLLAAGAIFCLTPGCPEPRAAQKILSDPETLDVVTFTPYGFTVLHPLRERLEGQLFDCPVHRACGDLGGPPDGYGRYRVSLDENRKLAMEKLPVLA
jgi:hypothetical protein